MHSPTGVPAVELAVLCEIAQHTDPGSAVRTSVLLAELDRQDLIGPRAALQVLSDLISPWRRHLPLVEGVGNWGDDLRGDPPADPAYTEVGLTATGRLAVEADAGRLGPVPLGLIDGSWYRGGDQPPYPPAAVLHALGVRDASGLVPAAPTAGTVTGEIAALTTGRPARLTVSASVVIEERDLVVTALPYGVHAGEAMDELVHRAHAHERPPAHRAYLASDQRRLDPPPSAPITDARDESSSRRGVRIVAPLRRGADPVAARTWLESMRPFVTVVDARLPAPLSDLISDWDPGDGSGLRALADLVG